MNLYKYKIQVQNWTVNVTLFRFQKLVFYFNGVKKLII